MKIIFIEARKKLCKFNIDTKDAKKLPKKIGLISTVQYISFLPSIKKELEKKGKKISIAKGTLAKYKGQILGCDINAAKKLSDVDAFLFIGSGKFHAEQVALATNKQVFILQPENNRIYKIKEEDILKLKARKKAALANFLAAEQVGILVSIKPGQENLRKALNVKKELHKKGRKAFIFLADVINISELENFSCKGLAWLNAACPAFNMEPRVLNLEDIDNIDISLF